jgi:hypothetical protein
MLQSSFRILPLLCVLFIKYTDSFPDGATVESCYNYRPGHGGEDHSIKKDVAEFFSVAAKPTGREDGSIQGTLIEHQIMNSFLKLTTFYDKL